MANPRISVCDGCGNESKIVKGWSTRASKLCMTCKLKEDIGKKKKPVAAVTPRHITKLNMDDIINKEIWEERPHVCEECGDNLPKIPVKSYFSHLLSKGAHPELRHDKDNIVLHCKPCHNKWEFAHNFRQSSATYRKHLAYMQRHSLL